MDFLHKTIHRRNIRKSPKKHDGSQAVSANSQQQGTKEPTQDQQETTLKGLSPIKKVNFSMFKNTVLIPTAQEYKDLKLDNTLWYKDQHYNAFKKEALCEIAAFSQKQTSGGKPMTNREILSKLYQPTMS